MCIWGISGVRKHTEYRYMASILGNEFQKITRQYILSSYFKITDFEIH